MGTPSISACMEIKDGTHPAKIVLMPGDPLRAKYVAETYLENPVLFNDVRGMLGYTGIYDGEEISVMGSGMGIPSISLYAHELFTQFGVEGIIRIGSAHRPIPQHRRDTDCRVISRRPLTGACSANRWRSPIRWVFIPPSAPCIPLISSIIRIRMSQRRKEKRDFLL